MINFFHDINKNFQPFKVLVDVNIKTTVLSNRLGWLWWILDPLFLMAIYYFLIKGIFGKGGENYHVFVLTGIVSWQFFARSLTDAMGAIHKNKQIIQQVSFPLSLLIAVPIVARLFFAMIGVLIIACFEYSVVGLHTLAVLPILFIISIFAYGAGIFVSVASLFISDVKKFIAYIIRAGFFCTPILYPASRLLESPNIPEQVKFILQLNPMMWTISALRGVLIEGKLYSWQECLFMMVVALLIMQLGLMWLKRNTSQIKKM